MGGRSSRDRSGEIQALNQQLGNLQSLLQNHQATTEKERQQLFSQANLLQQQVSHVTKQNQDLQKTIRDLNDQMTQLQTLANKDRDYYLAIQSFFESNQTQIVRKDGATIVG